MSEVSDVHEVSEVGDVNDMSEVNEVNDVSDVGEEKTGEPSDPVPVERKYEELKEGDRTSNTHDVFGVFASKLDGLKEQLGVLEAEFKSKIKYDGHKEKIIDNLHREVQEYKNDLIKNLLRPVITDIIFVVDDITRLAANYRAADPSGLDPVKLLQQMEDISSDLKEILLRQGVESFNCREPEFNPKRQKIVKTIPINDQSKDRTVSQRIQDGYGWEENVLRRERVNVYVYKAGLPEDEDPETDKNKEKES